MEHEIISRVNREGAPLLDRERSQAIFVWRGRQPPQLIGDFNDWCSPSGTPDGQGPHEPMQLYEQEPGLWTCILPFAPDAYIEYSYVVNGRRALDPLNPRATSNGIGDDNNYFYMPAAAPTPLALRQRGAEHGQVTRYVVEAGDAVVSGKRTVYLYQPPVPGPCPLLVVLDGHDYLRRAKLANMVDNLIAQGRIGPVALALVDSSAAARFIEYACSDATVGFLLDVVVPFAREHLDLLDARRMPGAHGVLGASMGGVMALYAAFRAPEVFGAAISQSGAFCAANRDLVIYELVRQCNPKPLRAWLDVGTLDGLLDCNRRMAELLMSKGYDVTYREYNAGHNFPAWRDDLWRGLEALYGMGR